MRQLGRDESNALHFLNGCNLSEIIKAMKLRDRLKRDKKFEDYKKQRNKVTSLVRAAQKKEEKKLTSQN